MDTILVPVDFSPSSDVAAQFAVDLARKLKTRLTFFYSYHPLPYAPEVYAFITKEELERLQREARQELKDWCSPYEKMYPGKCTFEASEGRAGDEILSMMTSIQPVLTVMGRKGMSQVKRALLGSVSMQVIRKATGPVILVPEEGFQGDLGRMMFATDYRSHDFERIGLLEQIAKAFKAEITMVHVVPSERREFIEDSLMKQYAETVRSRMPYKRLRFEVINSTNGVETAVADLIRKKQVGMLGVARRRNRLFNRLLLPGFTNQAGQHTKIPLLIFPDAGHSMTMSEMRLKTLPKSKRRAS